MIGNNVESGTVASVSPKNPSTAPSDNFLANHGTELLQQIDSSVENNAMLVEMGTSDNPTTTEPPYQST